MSKTSPRVDGEKICIGNYVAFPMWHPWTLWSRNGGHGLDFISQAKCLNETITGPEVSIFQSASLTQKVNKHKEDELWKGHVAETDFASVFPTSFSWLVKCEPAMMRPLDRLPIWPQAIRAKYQWLKFIEPLPCSTPEICLWCTICLSIN